LFKIPKKLIILLGAIVLVTIAALNFNNHMVTYNFLPMDFSDFVQETESGNIREVIIKGTHVTGQMNNGTLFATVIPYQDHDLLNRLMRNKVHIKASAPEQAPPSLLNIILSWLPTLFIIGMWVLLFKQMGPGSGRTLNFAKIKSNKSDKSDRVTFKDVAGAEEAKEDLQEIVDLIKDPSKYEKVGAKMPKGALLFGPPGTGKTLLARAVAGEAQCSFISVSGSNFVEMFVGVGAMRVRQLFEEAKAKSPCVVFIDEIDSLGRQRGVGVGGGNDEREQTLNELLVQLDGFEKKQRIFVLAATNRPDILDKALVRSGRFDRQITVGLPDLKQRLAILKVHAAKVILADKTKLDSIARGTVGFSGADLENLTNEAALFAARENHTSIKLIHFEKAKDKIMMGAEKRTLTMSEEEKKITAYHEAGHAIVASYCKYSDPIHKATIVPRGMALGMVVQHATEDRVSISKIQMIERIRTAMGGRAAEMKVFGADRITAGASNDIQVATNIAKKMVLEYGMSKAVGMVNYNDSSSVHFGQSQNNHSETVATMLDNEIKNILDDAYKFVENLLNKEINNLHVIAKALLEKETLTGEEIKNLLNKTISKKERSNVTKKMVNKKSRNISAKFN
jgi:cell division protease FtsH